MNYCGRSQDRGRRREEEKIRVVVLLPSMTMTEREQSIIDGIYEDEYLLLPLAFALCQVIVLC